MLLSLAVAIGGCASAVSHVPELHYPGGTQQANALNGATAFKVTVDPAFFKEVEPRSLLSKAWGITAIAWHGGEDRFGGGVRANGSYFGRTRFTVIGNQILLGPFGPEEALPDAGRKSEEILPQLFDALLRAIEGGSWSVGLRESIGYTDTHALAVVDVLLNDPSDMATPGDTEGIIQLCVSYIWDPETQPVRPQPRVFIPSSRTTAEVFELDPDHVPTLLDHYRRILEAVEGPYDQRGKKGD